MGRKPFVREKILEAAFDLIARRGYEAVSTREIATAAGVGPTSMYRHFPSKEDLGRELYALAIPPLAQALDAHLAEQPAARPPAAGFVHALCQALYQAYDDRPRALALLIFPPHDFTPPECAIDNPQAIRSRLTAALSGDEDHAALVWGACVGPLNDRFLHRRSGTMSPLATTNAHRICHLLPGDPS